MKTIFYIVLAIALLLMSGCGTILIMSDNGGLIANSELFPYCGTLLDLVAFLVFITGQEGANGIQIALLALIDLPFSFLADTLCLPYTLIKWLF